MAEEQRRRKCIEEAQAEHRRHVAACDAARGTSSPQQHRECLDAANAKFDAALERCRSGEA